MTTGGKKLVQQPEPKNVDNKPVVTGSETPIEPSEPSEPMPEQEGPPFYKAVLEDPSNVDADVLDETYKRATLLRDRLTAEVHDIDASLEEMRAITLRKKGERPACFGQYDASPNCIEVCRDPVCPDYTNQTRAARDRARSDQADKDAESLGKTRNEFSPHQPIELADGTVIITEQ